MNRVVFITGNPKKAEYLSNFLGYPIKHIKLELEEIQSLDLQAIVRHKVRQAYAIVKRPVLVEDVSLECMALGRLPGPFIRWFLEELSPATICSLLDGRDRRAVARSVFGYYDGISEKLFEGSLPGTIAKQPSGTGGYGWDSIFIPEGYTVTRATLKPEDDQVTYQRIKPLEAVRHFLDAGK